MKCIKSMGYWLALSMVWLCSFSSNGSCASLMVEKNLFAPDRKPPSPESVTPTPQPNKSGLSAKAVQLDGVIIRGDTKKALLRVKGQVPGAEKAKTQNPYVAVGEGEKLGDFQVLKIETRSVSLERDGQTEVINMFAEGKMVVPPPPTPASPVAPSAPAQQGQTQPAAHPGQVAAQPAQPPVPPGTPGMNVPGVAKSRAAARMQRGHQRVEAEAPPAQFDDNPPPDEDVEVEEDSE